MALNTTDEKIERLAKAIESLIEVKREDSALMSEMRMLMREIANDIDSVRDDQQQVLETLSENFISLARQVQELSRDAMEVARGLSRSQIDTLRKELYEKEQREKHASLNNAGAFENEDSGVHIGSRGIQARANWSDVREGFRTYGKWAIGLGAGAGILQHIREWVDAVKHWFGF